MSRSIPESSWVESPLFMSRSAGYRSAPHPLEPENSELSDSSDSNIAISQPKRSVRRLGTDLLRMFLEEIGPDVVVEVEGHKLKAHKCILASRCQYFAALLSGNWLEASGNVISLQVSNKIELIRFYFNITFHCRASPMNQSTSLCVTFIVERLMFLIR